MRRARRRRRKGECSGRVFPLQIEAAGTEERGGGGGRGREAESDLRLPFTAVSD